MEALHGYRCHIEAQGGQTKADDNHTQKTSDSQGSSARNLEPQEAMGNEKPLQDSANRSEFRESPDAWRNRLAV